MTYCRQGRRTRSWPMCSAPAREGTSRPLPEYHQALLRAGYLAAPQRLAGVARHGWSSIGNGSQYVIQNGSSQGGEIHGYSH